MRSMYPPTMSLVVIVWFVVGLVATVPVQAGSDTKLDAIEKRFAKAFASEDHAEIIKVGIEFSKLAPNETHLQYLLAEAYAVQGDNENAMKWLNKCADNGYDNIGPSKKWKKFAALRSDPKFEETLEQIRETRRKTWEAYTTEAKANDPLVITPPSYTSDTIVPMVVVMHRHGGSVEEIVEIFREPAKRIGAILVVPKAIRKVKGGGLSWGDTFGWRKQRQDIFEADFLVMNAAEKVMQEYTVDQEKFFVAGYAQGAEVALWATQFHSNVVRGVLAIAPRDYQLFERYRGSLRLAPPRFYVIVGENDERLTDCLQIEEQIRGANMPVKINVLDGIVHDISTARIDAIADGLKYLMGE